MTAPSGVRPRSRGIISWDHLPASDRLARIVDQILLATRRMWRNRTVTALVVASLAIGVGANTAIFSLIDALFLEPAPFRDPSRLVAVRTTDPKNPGLLGFSYPNFLDVRAGTPSFEELAASGGLHVNIGERGNVTENVAELTTPNYFTALGIEAGMGKLFSSSTMDEQDDESARVAAISHNLWQTRFASDPRAVGRTLLINQIPFRIVAVLPEDFRGIERIFGTEVWIPFANYGALAERPTWVNARRALLFQAFGRLKPGATTEQAGRELDAVGKRLAERYPETNAGRSFQTAPLEEMLLGSERRTRLMNGATVAMFAAGLVLLIAIANASNVLLGHSAGRRREMALRLAMGATRRDFFSQIVVESLLLVAAGGVIGLALGIAGREILWSFRPDDITAKDMSLSLNPRVLAFSLGVSVLAGALANLLPALQALRGEVGGILQRRDCATGKLGCRLTARYLVVGQVALSLVALVGANLFLRLHQSVQRIDPGFDSRTLAMAEVNPRRLGLQQSQQAAFYEDLIQRIERLPGVRSAAVASDPVFGFHRLMRTVRINGETHKPSRFVHVTSVSTRYFETTDILVVRGRAFASSDTGSEPLVAIVNESMGRLLSSGDSALGKRFRLFGDPEERVVVGVARDTSFAELGKADLPLVYVPMSQDTVPTATVHVRAESDPPLVTAAIAAEIRRAEPNHPVAEVKTISQVMDRALWSPRMAAGLLTAFGLMAMFLATLGVYGVTSHLIAQRSAEIGLRMAVGACPVDVKQLILGQAVTLILPGLLIGAVAAFALARLMAATILPMGETAFEPYLASALLLAACALVASYLPARRAVKLMPAVALRQD